MKFKLLTAISLLLFQVLFSLAQSQPVATYSATYSLEYKGRRAGEAEFSVRPESEAGVFSYRSHARLKGLLARLAAPRPVVEHSLFTAAHGSFEPRSFRYEDGSRKGEDNYGLSFNGGNATLELAAGAREIGFPPGALDRGTAQVRLAAAVAAGHIPATLEIIDDDGVETYAIETLGRANTPTGQGEIETMRVAQQRAGSSRRTVFWFAPALDFVPVRIEQMRDGQAETVFVLESIELDGQ